MKASKEKAEAIHMKTSIWVPTWALMLMLGSAFAKTLAKITNMTVATAEPTIVTSAVKNVMMSMGRARSQTKVRRRWGGAPDTGQLSGLECCASQFLMYRGCREETAKGATKIMTKLSTAAERRRPNIQWEARRANLRGSSMSEGSATGFSLVCLGDAEVV